MDALTEKTDGLRCCSPRCDHFHGYKERQEVRNRCRSEVAKDSRGQSKVNEVIDGDKRILIG